MKYADIPLKTARKCCKQHSYKNKDGEVIHNCKTCPLERIDKEKHLFCWFILMNFNKWCKTHINDYTEEKYITCNLDEEYNALKDEEVTKILEWENWINSQEALP